MNSLTNPFKAGWALVAALLALLAYVVLNILRLGGDDLVYNFNSAIVIPFALGATVAVVVLWRRIAVSSRDQLLWGGMSIGLALWTIAEMYWAVAGYLGAEVPYPSLADAFWLLGYLPLYLALIARGRDLPLVANRRRLLVPLALSLLSLTATVFLIFIPIVRAGEPANGIENALNLLYPLSDLVLLILVLRLFFSYEQGEHGGAWNWIMLSFVFTSLGDLVFTFASAADLYYPDGKANLLSTLGADVPYTLSYVFMLLGAVLRLTRDKQTSGILEQPAALDLVPTTHVLVLLQAADRVTTVSDNCIRIFPGESFSGKHLAELLGVSRAETDQLLRPLTEGETLSEVEATAMTRAGKQRAWISGIPLVDAGKQYEGAVLLVRLVSDDASVDSMLSEYQRTMVRSVMEKTGTDRKEDEQICTLLGAYFGGLLTELIDRAEAEGGPAMTNALVGELTTQTRQNGWDMEIQGRDLLAMQRMSARDLRVALPALVAAATRFVARLTDEATAAAIVSRAREKFDTALLRNIESLMAVTAPGARQTAS